MIGGGGELEMGLRAWNIWGGEAGRGIPAGKELYVLDLHWSGPVVQEG